MQTKKFVIAALFAAAVKADTEDDDIGDRVREQIRDKFKQQITNDLGEPQTDVAGDAVEEVICDQGDDGLWEAAQDHFQGLVKELGEAAAKKKELQDKLSPLKEDYDAKKLVSDAHMNADNTKNALAAYHAAYDLVYGDLLDDTAEWTPNSGDPTAAAIRSGGLKDAAETLVGSTNGKVATALSNMNDKIQVTTDIETAVKNQRDRVEHLVEVAVHQKAEAASWAERVSTAETAFDNADVLRVAADAALALVEEQLTKRSWLQRTLGYLDTAQWYGAKCDTAGNKNSGADALCQYLDTGVKVADQVDETITSWAWPSGNHCDFTDVANANADAKCKILGLYVEGGSGLYQAAITALGVTQDGGANPPVAASTLLVKDFQDADYAFDASGGTTLQATALTNYLPWQKALLLSESMLAMCWTAAGAQYNLGTSDAADKWCQVKADGTATNQKWHPLIQDATANANAAGTSQAFRAAATASAQSTFTASRISAVQQQAKARAQGNLLVTKWMALAYLDAWRGITQGIKVTAEETEGAGNDRLIYDQADAVGRRSFNSANAWEVQTKDYVHGTPPTWGSWANTDLGMAEAAQATALDAANAQQMQRDALKSFNASADTDVVNADNDVARAQVLLEGLVAEIAPAARDEQDTRAAHDALVLIQVAQAAAEVELGANIQDAATGAYEILNQAKATNDDLAAQQEFHDARTQWAMDKMSPTKTLFDAAADRVTELTEMTREAHGMLEAAKERCKAAAFGMAQEALKKSAEVAAQRVIDIAAVKEQYDAVAKFPEGGVAGSLCHYPNTPEGEAQAPRVPCLEGDPENPLCCGAAQRFLKDGTKLSIETCQPRDSTTYKYYPALPKDALVAPTAETWRFQCISAAQKLAAAAAAALAAGYMMA